VKKARMRMEKKKASWLRLSALEFTQQNASYRESSVNCHRLAQTSNRFLLIVRRLLLA
jgi:hypothetical protein